MRRFLVVVNQTLGGEQLGRAVLERAAAGPSRFFIIVPATPPREHLTWTEGGARAIADHRLKRALARIHALGLEANGEIGDANPLFAVGDAWRHERFDEIILFSPIATHPVG